MTLYFNYPGCLRQQIEYNQLCNKACFETKISSKVIDTLGNNLRIKQILHCHLMLSTR